MVTVLGNMGVLFRCPHIFGYIIHMYVQFVLLCQQELIHQGEALKRAERMVNNMAQDMKTSQKHINSIKSVWGGLVNYFKGNSESRPPQKDLPSDFEPSNRYKAYTFVLYGKAILYGCHDERMQTNNMVKFIQFIQCLTPYWAIVF